MTIVHAIKKWQPCLVGRHFIIKIDHHSLKYFLQSRAHTYFQQKWVSKLLGFDYEIQYKQGCDNQVADALSILPSSSAECSELFLHNQDCLEHAEFMAISYPYMS